MQDTRDQSPHRVISRGSAPRATFQIPETGLRPAPDSFLTRFRNALSVSSPAPKPSTPPPSAPAASAPDPDRVNLSPPRYVDLSRPSQAARASELSQAELAADAAEDTLINILTDTDTDAATDPNTDYYQHDRDADLPDTPTRLSASVTPTITSPTPATTAAAGTDSPLKNSNINNNNNNNNINTTNNAAASIATTTTSPNPAMRLFIQAHSPSKFPSSAPRPPPSPRSPNPDPFAAATPVLRFCASHALLDQHALDQLGLPLGFVWSPFGALPAAVPVSHAPPRCGTCGSFLALGNGAEAVLAGARVWTCSFCGRNDNVVTNFHLAALSSAAVEYTVPDVQQQQHSQPRSENHRSGNPQPRPSSTPALGVSPVASANAAFHNAGGINWKIKTKSVPSGIIFLVIDENLSETQAECARAAAASVHAAAAARGLRFALLTVGAGCAVAVRSDNVAQQVATLDMMSVARAAKLTPQQKEQYFLRAPLLPTDIQPDPHDPASLAHFHAVTDDLIVSRAPYGEEVTGPNKGMVGGIKPQSSIGKNNSVENVPNGTPNGQHYANGNVNFSTAAKGEVSPARDRSEAVNLPCEEPRRLDVGISVALELLADAADCDHSRVITMLTGPPTLSEHAQRRRPVSSTTFGSRGTNGAKSNPADEQDAQLIAALTRLYEQVGSRAGEMRVALDFLNFGLPTDFGAHILLAAAKRSRGGLVYGAAHSFSAAEAVADAATYLAQRSTTPGVVSIRVSSPLVVARVIGPAYPTAAPHTYAVPGVDPTAGFTIILKTKSGLEDAATVPDHTIVQLAAKSGDVTRVVTARVPVTRVPDEYLAGLDAEVCALVLAKACVVSAGGLTNPGVAARSVDEAVRRLLYGTQGAVGVARLLYELRRGTLLHEHLSVDAALVLRAWFLRAECGIASLLMSPRLFTNTIAEKETGLMGEVPLERQNVREDAVLVLDTGFNVFVYVGEKADEAAETAICKSAQSVAAVRVSPCQLWKLRSGPDADYVLDAYLSRNDRRKNEPAIERGFVEYCQWLAPKSDVVRALCYG